MSYYVNETVKSDTYISAIGAAEEDRAYFITAPAWVDSLTQLDRDGSKFRTVGGGLHRQSYARLETGRTITLEGDETFGLIFDTDLAKIQTLINAGGELELSQDDGATKYIVEHDPEVTELDMRPVDMYKKRAYTGALKFIFIRTG